MLDRPRVGRGRLILRSALSSIPNRSKVSNSFFLFFGNVEISQKSTAPDLQQKPGPMLNPKSFKLISGLLTTGTFVPFQQSRNVAQTDQQFLMTMPFATPPARRVFAA